MSAAVLKRFDRTVPSSYEWLDHVAARLGGERRDAYNAMHAVLGALRDRVPVDVAGTLAAQMPLLVRGIFLDGFEPARTPLRLRTTDDFVGEVRTSLAASPRIDAMQAVDAVLDALANNVDPAVFDKVRLKLPRDVRALLALPDLAPTPSNDDSTVAAHAT